MQSLVLVMALAIAGVENFGAIEPHGLVDRVNSEVKSSSLEKEITIGCLATPIPTTPSGPTWSYQVNTSIPEFPEVVRGTFWRRPCATANDAQLILTFTPVTGSSFVCADVSRMVLVQNSQQTNDFFFDTSPNSATLDQFCGRLFIPTSVVIDERSSSFVFDDDSAFTFIHAGGIPTVPTATTNVGAYDPAAYGLGSQSQLISGKLSGSYYDPARNGEGVVVEIGRVGARRTIFLTWYTYAGGAQRWIVGNIDYAAGATEVVIPLIVTSGGQFGSAFVPSQVQAASFGSATVSFPTCATMRFEWTETGGQSGSYNYQRLVDGLEGIVCP